MAADIFTTTNILIAAVIGVIILIAGRQAGWDPLDELGWTKQPSQMTGSGVERIYCRTESPRVIDVGEGSDVVIEYADLVTPGSNWIAEAQGVDVDKMPWHGTIKKDELDLNRDAPRQLFGSNAIYLKLYKEGKKNAELRRIGELEEIINNMSATMSSLRTQVELSNMSNETKVKFNEALEAVPQRERFKRGYGTPDDVPYGTNPNKPIGGT